MHFKLKLMASLFLLSLCGYESLADNPRYVPAKSCLDSSKTCVSRGEKVMDGFRATKDCWEWSYTKTCSFPSKDNCKNYAHCYFAQNLPCLFRDAYGTCVNLQKEFSCKSWDPVMLQNQTTRYSLELKDGIESVVCKGIPCVDGNCVSKAYTTDGSMMDSISKLYAMSKVKPDKDGAFSLFKGTNNHCSKKATSYTNCCKQTPDGWGKNLGAGCTKDEQLLMELRAKKLCIYVGKESKQRAGMTSIAKHHFCCFPTMLDKVVQVEGRKQLGLNFGSGGIPNCRGLTLDEIQRLDFSKMDFTEFIEDFRAKFTGKYKSPDKAQIASKIESTSKNLRSHDKDLHNKQNNISGHSKAINPKDLEAGEGE